MFSKNHYINIFSLVITAIVNSIVLSLVFSRSSVFLPLLYIAGFISVMVILGNRFFPNNSSVIRVFMILLSPVTYYVLLLEYSFLVNSVLIIFMILFILKYTDFNRMDARFFIAALLIGITLYMNLSLLLLYILFVLFFYRKSVVKILLFGLFVEVICFLLNSTGLLSAGENVGGLKSTLAYHSVWIRVLLILISVYAGWIIADMQEYFFAGGILTLIPSVLLLYTNQGSLENNAFAAVLSMSYTAFSVFLLILSVKPYKVDRYLGKVLA